MNATAAPAPAREQPDPNVATLAGITHLLFFAQSIGMIVAVVLWATRGKEQRYLAFQCAQATFIQAGFFILNIAYAVAFTIVWVGGSLAAVGLSDSDDEAGVWAAGVGIALIFGSIIGYMLLWLVVGAASVWLAVRCFQGHDPTLPGIAALATRATGYSPRTTTETDADGAHPGH